MAMKLHKWSDLRRKYLSPEQIKANDDWARSESLRMQLAELREAAGKTQAEVGEAADMVQSEISRTERREDHLVSTLRRYVEALGGELEIRAIVNGRRIRLSGV